MANQTRVVRPAGATALPADTLAGPTPGIAAAIFFAVSLFYFLPAFLPGQQIFGTDYLEGGYFFYDFISQRFAAGSLPKWVPYIFGGMPLAANPGSTYYPIHVIGDLLLPTWKVLPFVFWFQFGIAGFGMYLLARELRCREWIAFVAGIAFQFTGITMSWVYAGHDGRIIVATLAPLLFFFLHAGVRTARLAPFAGAAATVGFALLSFQIQTAYYLLLAAAAWAVFAIVHLGVFRRGALLGKTLALGLGAVAFGFVMATVNFIPFLGYSPESTRGAGEGRGFEYAISYSMPEAELLSMAVPEQAGVSVQDQTTGEPLFPAYQGENGFKLHTEYVGALALIGLALGFYFSRRNRYWWFFLGLSVFFLTVALGGNTPLYRLYYEILPGTKRFRAPSLSFFVIATSLVVMAALTLERIAALRETRAQEGEDRLDLVPWIVGGVLVLAIGGAAMASGTPATPGAPSAAQGWGRFILFTAAVGGGLWMWARGTLGPVGALTLLSLVTAADLWTIDRRFFQTVPPPDQIFAADDVATFLQGQPGPFRVWSLPIPIAGIGTWGGNGSYGGDRPMYYGIEQVGGEHPNPMQRWNELVGAGTATYIDWHNLLQNPRVVGDTITGQAMAFESAQGILDAANVRYVVSMAPLAHTALREVHRGSALVYENASALPRAYLVPTVRETPAGGAEAQMRQAAWDPRLVAFVEPGTGIALPATPLQGSAQVAEYEPDRVVVRSRASRPALLVLADNMYEGWRATVDGAPAEVHRVNHTLRGVVVPEGEHSVEFTFAPDDLRLGLYLYLATLASLAGYAVYLLVRSRRSRAPEAA